MRTSRARKKTAIKGRYSIITGREWFLSFICMDPSLYLLLSHQGLSRFATMFELLKGAFKARSVKEFTNRCYNVCQVPIVSICGAEEAAWPVKCSKYNTLLGFVGRVSTNSIRKG